MWIKKGCIFKLDDADWRTNHVQVPTVLLFDDFIRIYYACRSRENKSFPAYVDMDYDLKTILRIHESPIMDLGDVGMFDDCGVMPSCAIRNNGEIWLFFIGWNERVSGARYQNEIGLAISKDNGETFKRMFRGPIIGRSATEPGLAVMPFVLKNNIFHLWYQSLTSWEKIEDQYEPVYVIKHAESTDGIKWKRNPIQCVKSNYPLEAFSRPSVLFKDNIYHQWFCYRDSNDYRGGTGSYRIGYAKSSNGVNFERLDSMGGLTVSESGWDSEMVCYPTVVGINGKPTMFYNGNGFGQSGIGVAVWEN